MGRLLELFLQGFDKDKAAYWNVKCLNGRAYTIQIPSDPFANTRILDCNIMKSLGIECFKKFTD